MSDVKKCPHCGKLIHNSAQYCMFCMTSLVAKQDITPSTNDHSKKATIALLLLALVVLLPIPFLISNCVSQPPGPEEPALENHQAIPEAPELDIRHTEEQQTDTQQSPISETPGPARPIENEPSFVNTETHTKDEPSTTPAQTQPTCNHYYIAASCIDPMTCKTCGDTVGTADSSAHTWQPVYSVVHHDEVGHYENKAIPYQKTVYLCFFCGYNQTGYDSLDDLREHISVHSGASNYDRIVSYPDMLADTREVWATKYEQQWVVDEEAHDETVLTGYTCTLCGSKKDP